MKPPVPQPPIQPPKPSEPVETSERDESDDLSKENLASPRAGTNEGGRSQGLVGNFGPLVDLWSQDDGAVEDKNS